MFSEYMFDLWLYMWWNHIAYEERSIYKDFDIYSMFIVIGNLYDYNMSDQWWQDIFQINDQEFFICE